VVVVVDDEDDDVVVVVGIQQSVPKLKGNTGTINGTSNLV